MEYKNMVFNAARDGKIRKLKVFLDHRPKDEVQMLVSARTNGATPLVMAARNGHLDVAEYLVERCTADIEQVGSVTFDGETIEGAPPLWCAAAAGHMQIVELLVKSGANVNSTTKTNSTPLRAACFDGHFQIVEYLILNKADIEVANRHGHTCLMIACYKGHFKIARYLIEIDANVNRKTVKGNTALHDCAESGSLEIMKLLLRNGAKMDVDSYGMTPLLAASVTGHTHIVEFLIQLPNIDRPQRIDALELLGATYVDKKRDMMGALLLWKRAMKERSDDAEILPKPKCFSSIAAYENAVEVSTHEQLDELISDPDEMRMQALLVRERILGPAHPDTSYFIRYRGAVYADTGNFERCIALWMYALDMQQKILDPLNPMTQSSLLSFAELFSFMMGERHARHCPQVQFADLLSVFKKGVKEIKQGLDQMQKIPVGDRETTHLNRTLLILMHLLCLMCRVQPLLNKEEEYAMHKAAYDFVQLQPRGRNGWTLLHLACAKDSSTVGRYPICSFPSVEVVQFLCTVGASPSIQDYDGNTPLHISGMNKPFKPEVALALLRNGAHFDATNFEGRSLLHLVKNPDSINPVPHTSLQCLAARTVKKHNLEQLCATLPQHIKKFIDIH